MKKILLCITLILLSVTSLFAQEEKSYRGEIKEVKEVVCPEMINEEYICFQYTVYIQELDREEVTQPMYSESTESKFKKGNSVYITSVTDEFGNEGWSITGYVRGGSLILLLTIFCIIALCIGKKQGLGSLLSLGFTFVILYLWAIPKILAGSNVIVIGVITVLITLISIMYMSHGFNRKSTIAVISTVIGILIVGIFAKIFTSLTYLDGSGSEEAFYFLVKQMER